MDEIQDRIYASAIAAGDARRREGRGLDSMPDLAPLEAQVRLLHQVTDWARSQGLDLPPFCVRWKRGAPGVSDGCIRFDTRDRGPSDRVIYLDATRLPWELVRVVAHELQHLHDYRSGKYSRVELEQRANAFAATVPAVLPDVSRQSIKISGGNLDPAPVSPRDLGVTSAIAFASSKVRSTDAPQAHDGRSTITPDVLTPHRTRGDALRLIQGAGFPFVRVGRRTVAGLRQWRELVRTEPKAIVNQFLDAAWRIYVKRVDPWI